MPVHVCACAIGLYCNNMQELELELLKANQKLAVGASEHTQEMKDQAAQLERCRVSHLKLVQEGILIVLVYIFVSAGRPSRCREPIEEERCIFR